MIFIKDLSKEFKIPVKKEGRFSTIRNLFSSDYKIKKAVDDISFNIKKGEIIGFIGKNGAGKSTTIKMLSGILQPTKGEITINGINPFDNRIDNARKIGVVFGQKSQLWWDVPLIESFNLLSKIYDITEKQYKENLDLFIPMLGLSEVLNKPVRQMSLGERVKSDIVASLLHNPSILFLDEPTIGVDVVSKKALYDFILKVNKEKKTTILLTTHDLNDMEKLTNKIILIDEGKLMYEGTLEDMTSKYGTKRSIMIEFEKPTENFDIPKTEFIKSDENKKYYSFNRYETTPTTIINYVSDNHAILDLKVIEPDVEEIVRNLYEKS